MVSIINTSNNNDISAFLTVALISHTHKVENTRAIVDLWDDLRKHVDIDSKAGCISAILATGRIMDLKKELLDQKFITAVNELINSITADIKKREHLLEITDTHFVTALLTSAYISRTNMIETISLIVDQWEELHDTFNLQTDLDKVAAILTTGRLLENKYMINNVRQILDVFNLIKERVSSKISGAKISRKDIAAAFLTNANIETSPKVENIQNIIDMWYNFGKGLVLQDDIDYTVTLLTYGRVRDIDVEFFVTDNIINDIRTSLRNHIDSKFD